MRKYVLFLVFTMAICPLAFAQNIGWHLMSGENIYPGVEIYEQLRIDNAYKTIIKGIDGEIKKYGSANPRELAKLVDNLSLSEKEVLFAKLEAYIKDIPVEKKFNIKFLVESIDAYSKVPLLGKDYITKSQIGAKKLAEEIYDVVVKGNESKYYKNIKEVSARTAVQLSYAEPSAVEKYFDILYKELVSLESKSGIKGSAEIGYKLFNNYLSLDFYKMIVNTPNAKMQHSVIYLVKSRKRNPFVGVFDGKVLIDMAFDNKLSLKEIENIYKIAVEEKIPSLTPLEIRINILERIFTKSQAIYEDLLSKTEEILPGTRPELREKALQEIIKVDPKYTKYVEVFTKDIPNKSLSLKNAGAWKRALNDLHQDAKNARDVKIKSGIFKGTIIGVIIAIAIEEIVNKVNQNKEVNSREKSYNEAISFINKNLQGNDYLALALRASTDENFERVLKDYAEHRFNDEQINKYYESVTLIEDSALSLLEEANI